MALGAAQVEGRFVKSGIHLLELRLDGKVDKGEREHHVADEEGPEGEDVAPVK